MDYVSNSLYGDFDAGEAHQRLPEITDIRDGHIRNEVTAAVVDIVPDYFWTAPAASKYHPAEHRERHGLWLHTKRVCTAFERYIQSMQKQGHFTGTDADAGRAACILHDALKFGHEPTSVNGTIHNHDRLGATVLSEETDLPQKTIDAVDEHNGPWYAGDAPSSHVSQIVHVADMTASDVNVDVAVKDPHDVLQQQFPNVEVR